MSYARILKNLQYNKAFSSIRPNKIQLQMDIKDKQYFQNNTNKLWYVRHTRKQELEKLPLNKTAWLMVFYIQNPQTQEKELFRIPILDSDTTPKDLGIPIEKDSILIDEANLYQAITLLERQVWRRSLPLRQRRISKLIEFFGTSEDSKKLSQLIDEALNIFTEQQENKEDIQEDMENIEEETKVLS